MITVYRQVWMTVFVAIVGRKKRHLDTDPFPPHPAQLPSARVYTQAQARVQLGRGGKEPLSSSSLPSPSLSSPATIAPTVAGADAGACSTTAATAASGGIGGAPPIKQQPQPQRPSTAGLPLGGVGKGIGLELGVPGGVGGGGQGGSTSWGRAAFAGRAGSTTGPPRRQRHKVSSKDLTEEQRIERRCAPHE